jgi:hypothetical protein
MSRWYLLCDSCGRKITNLEARKRWDGLIVCPNDWEVKHPALTYRPSRTGASEGSTAARSGFVRSEPEDTFVFVCDVYTSMGVAGYGTAGCAQAGTYNLGMSPLPSLTVVPIVENRIIP